MVWRAWISSEESLNGFKKKFEYCYLGSTLTIFYKINMALKNFFLLLNKVPTTVQNEKS